MVRELLSHCLIISELKVPHYEEFALNRGFPGMISWLRTTEAELKNKLLFSGTFGTNQKTLEYDNKP